MTIIYDGRCGFCRAFVKWLHRRTFTEEIRLLSSHEPRGLHCIADNNLHNLCETSVVVICHNDVHIKSDAVIRVFRNMKGFWNVAKYLVWVPKSLRDSIYDWVSRNRGCIGNSCVSR